MDRYTGTHMHIHIAGRRTLFTTYVLLASGSLLWSSGRDKHLFKQDFSLVGVHSTIVVQFSVTRPPPAEETGHIKEDTRKIHFYN